MAEPKKPSRSYKIIRKIIWFFYPKMKLYGQENLPDEAVILVGNHTQLHGPIAAELYGPGEHYTWCAGQMMHREDVAQYAFQDFWSQKPRYTHWFYRILSHLIVPLSLCVFNNANTIGVYHDTRIVGTFKNTVNRLREGANVVIFPEHDVKFNHIIYDFQDKFIDVAKLYYKRTGKAVCFVPLYIAPKLKGMYLGTPTRFQPEASMDQERQRIKDYLMQSITELAQALPEHTVVPYRNIPKRLYPKNTQGGTHETSCG